MLNHRSIGMSHTNENIYIYWYKLGKKKNKNQSNIIVEKPPIKNKHSKSLLTCAVSERARAHSLRHNYDSLNHLHMVCIYRYTPLTSLLNWLLYSFESGTHVNKLWSIARSQPNRFHCKICIPCMHSYSPRDTRKHRAHMCVVADTARRFYRSRRSRASVRWFYWSSGKNRCRTPIACVNG